jgi:4-hydroxy-2-oxoheptanedioate aldolase
VELAGHCGFDFVVLDTEHGKSDTGDLEHHLRAADSVGIPSLVRLGKGEPVETLRALDAGAAGIVSPHVNDAKDARAVVRAAHYPPVGVRGFAVSTRAGHHGRKGVAEHARAALEETVVVVQVEDAVALDQVAEIASVARVDAVFLGPNDLSVSLGHPGDLSHPEVAAAVDRIVEEVGRAKEAALCSLVGTEEEARDWEARGARLLLFSATALLGQRLSDIMAALRAERRQAAHSSDGLKRCGSHG